MRRAWVSVIGVCALAAAGAAIGQPAGEEVAAGAPAIEAASERITGEVLYTSAGQPVTLFHYFSVASDCAPAPAEVRLVQPPAHGRVTFAAGLEPPIAGSRPLWTAPDPRAQCLSRMVATRDATYAPDPGFAGHDQLQIEFQDGAGGFTDVIEVNVERLAPPAKPRKPADTRRRGRD
jgi:hypothetical protein